MNGNKLEDFDGDFPATFYFYDIENKELETMTVTEQTWNNTLKTFEDKDNISRNVIFKYMSKEV